MRDLFAYKFVSYRFDGSVILIPEAQNEPCVHFRPGKRIDWNAPHPRSDADAWGAQQFRRETYPDQANARASIGPLPEPGMVLRGLFGALGMKPGDLVPADAATRIEAFLTGHGFVDPRAQGWAQDPAFSQLTESGDLRFWTTSSGFTTYGTQQTGGVLGTLIDIESPAGAHSIQLTGKSFDGSLPFADPRTDHVVLEMLIRVIAGNPNDMRLRLEWGDSTTATYKRGRCFGIDECTGQLGNHWRLVTTPDRLQRATAVWTRPAGAFDRVQIIMSPKIPNGGAVHVQIEYLDARRSGG